MFTRPVTRTKSLTRPLLSALVVALGTTMASGVSLAASKYGVVDMQTVILNVTEGKEARAALEKEIKGKETELKKAKEELDKMNEDWKKQAPLLSESARVEKQQKFQEKFLELRNQEVSFQSDIKRKEQQATQKIAMSVTQLVDEMAKKRGLEMVFETSSAGLLYLKDPVDMTQDVIKAYESKGKGAKQTAKKH